MIFFMARSFSKYTQGWFSRGDDDLKTVEGLLAMEGIPNVICFHAQQAGEKYLKGFLAYHEKHIRKIHDLEALLELCLGIDEAFSVLRNEAGTLSAMYTESRYPDDYVDFKKEDAQEAFVAACRVKDFVLERIQAKASENP